MTPARQAAALGGNPDSDEPSGSTDETLAELIARSSKEPAPKATKHSSIIILTSGTTGTRRGHPQHPAHPGANRRHLVARAVQGR
ncbi:acyl-CoA synthetase domain protein [Mycobacterium xenopi 4042]|uniref:Acyl-CoA synthetase domain protein n=1 Tax=Mycobacterium xenopi 4042 TaxID=1299334 RepID=X7ZC13_MYCXE|nr:acyl-CoA synthetase domain protein [Mycobacterium xenopi 4042]